MVGTTFGPPSKAPATVGSAKPKRKLKKKRTPGVGDASVHGSSSKSALASRSRLRASAAASPAAASAGKPAAAPRSTPRMKKKKKTKAATLRTPGTGATPKRKARAVGASPSVIEVPSRSDASRPGAGLRSDGTGRSASKSKSVASAGATTSKGSVSKGSRKGNTKAKARAARSATSQPPPAAEAADGSLDVDSLVHQLSVERRKSAVLTQIVQEQGTLLEDLQTERNVSSSMLTSSRMSALGEDRLRRSVVDTHRVLKMMEKEETKTRQELLQLRKATKAFWGHIAKAQAAEAAALDGMLAAEARATAAEQRLRAVELELGAAKPVPSPSPPPPPEGMDGIAAGEVGVGSSTTKPAATPPPPPPPAPEPAASDSPGASEGEPPLKTPQEQSMRVEKLYQRYLASETKGKFLNETSDDTHAAVGSAGPKSSGKKRRPKRKSQASPPSSMSLASSQADISRLTSGVLGASSEGVGRGQGIVPTTENGGSSGFSDSATLSPTTQVTMAIEPTTVGATTHTTPEAMLADVRAVGEVEGEGEFMTLSGLDVTPDGMGMGMGGASSESEAMYDRVNAMINTIQDALDSQHKTLLTTKQVLGDLLDSEIVGPAADANDAMDGDGDK